MWCEASGGLRSILDMAHALSVVAAASESRVLVGVQDASGVGRAW